MGNWIDVKQQRPPEGDVVLLVVKSYVRATIGSYDEGQYWLDDEEEPLPKRLKVTHWQPLPELPPPAPAA